MQLVWQKQFVAEMGSFLMVKRCTHTEDPWPKFEDLKKKSDNIKDNQLNH